MSFLYDENIYSEIIKKAFIKESQNVPLSPNVVAKKLTNKLSRELSGVPEPLNISSSTPTSLTVNQLQNLGKLLQFMAGNQIRLDGNRIVYAGTELPSLPEDDKEKLVPITVNMSRDAATRKWNTADYYAHLSSLIQYISYLQKQALELKKRGEAQGKVLEVMIGKLIDSVNKIKPDSGLARIPKSTPDKPKEMPDEVVIDTFGQKIFDARNPYGDQGNIGLLAKNLNTRESLNEWMEGGGQFGPEAQVVMYDASGKRIRVPYTNTNPEANLCVVIHVLYLRAQRLLKMSKSPEDTKKYNYFINKINQIGPTFADPQGKACTIGVSDVDSLSKIVTDKHELVRRQTGSEISSATVSPQILEQLVQSLPLDTQDIDFNRIKSFFTRYTKIVSRDNAQSAITSMGTALTAMADASNKTLTGNQQNFRLTRNVQELQTWLRPPAGNIAMPFLYDLQQVIVETGKVLRMFYNEYARTLYSGDRQVFNAEQKALVEAQIVGNNSIYVQNLRDIQSLMANAQTILSGRK